MKDIRNLVEEVQNYSDEQLRRLNQAVVAALNNRQASADRSAVVRLNVGDQVKFNGGRRGEITITLDKINSRSVHGKTSEGRGWRVSPGLCTKI